MAIRTYKVTLDSKNTIAPEPVYLRQGDKTGAVVIDATLMDNGSPVSLNGLTPMFKANTADGQAVIADSTGFNIVNASGGEFTYQVPNALSAVPGKIITAYFSLSDTSGLESTFDVAFIIKKAVDITQAQADDYITIIDGTIDSLKQKIDKINAEIPEILANSVGVKGTFKNLDALIAAYPNGDSGFYVTLDDQHLHFWNRSQSKWSDIGGFTFGIPQMQESYRYARDQKNYFPNGDLLIPNQTDPYLPLNGVDLAYVSPTDGYSDDRSWVQVTGHDDDTPYKGVRVKLDLDTYPARYWRSTDLSFILRNDDTSDSLFHIEMNVFQKTGDPIVYHIGNFFALHDVNNKFKAVAPSPVSLGVKQDNIHSVYYHIWTEQLRHVNFHITGITGKFHADEIDLGPDPELARNNLLGTTDVRQGSIDPYVGLNGAEVLTFSPNIFSRNWITASGTDNQTVGKGIGIDFNANTDVAYSLDKKFTGLVRTLSTSNLNFNVAVSYKTSSGTVTKVIDTNIALTGALTKLEYTIPSPHSLGIDRAIITTGRIQVYSDNATDFSLSATEWSLKDIITNNGKAPTDDKPVIADNNLTLPTIQLHGNFETMTGDAYVAMQFQFNDHGRTINGYSKTKWQGDSSLRWPKKNLRLKLYTDATLATKLKIKPDPRFPKSHKFNLKANYIQTFSARNLVTSELLREVVSSRQSITPYVAGLNNYGAIVGFPVLLYINDNFYGLMTFNTTKHIITKHLPSKNPLAFAIEGESGGDADVFKASTATLTTGDDKSDFALLGKDKVTPEIQTSVNNFLKFVNESSDEDFKAHIAEHYDIDSAIDWILMVDAAQLFDMLKKNIIHLTEDGTKFYAMLYDLDGSFANGWQGTDKLDPNQPYLSGENKLANRILFTFKDKIKARYAELVSLGIFTTNHIQDLFETFITNVGQANYELDQNRWPDNPATKLFTYDETMDIVRKRMNVIKNDVSNL